ncbi:hypothetical protein PL263_13535 [Methylomonas sp. EFPC3]|uniref:hypothetical protein n=1 Tax=Methylomonas sp. EFPC3 TaxID=3021710 RepID=UPI002416ACA1|nr:hypothetical protein [Methylomonas sp. EFPC3]WFP49117.1 hypothetical protein PL263_13535 [Methylomonas sp. EFPC3]
MRRYLRLLFLLAGLLLLSGCVAYVPYGQRSAGYYAPYGGYGYDAGPHHGGWHHRHHRHHWHH